MPQFFYDTGTRTGFFQDAAPETETGTEMKRRKTDFLTNVLFSSILGSRVADPDPYFLGPLDPDPYFFMNPDTDPGS